MGSSPDGVGMKMRVAWISETMEVWSIGVGPTTRFSLKHVGIMWICVEPVCSSQQGQIQVLQ